MSPNNENFPLKLGCNGMNTKIKIFMAMLIGVLVSFVAYVQIFGLSFEGISNDFYLPTVSGANISIYEASCIDLNLSKVSENPDSLIGQKVKVKGELLKKEENPDNTTDILLKVPELSKYPYIIVRYSSEVPYNNGTELEVYGEYSRLSLIEEKYALTPLKSSNGAVPSINGVYIERCD